MSETDSGRVVVCRVGAERFALPISAVREIIATPPLTRIPGVPPAVRGLANVRGILVTAISGPALLGHDTAGAGDWLLVLTLRDGRVGVVMDEVEDLQTSGTAMFLPVLDIDALVRPLLAVDTIKG